MLQVGNFGIKVLSWILEDYKIDTYFNRES